MGCEVNGPGEAREADIGVAGTADGAILFVRGEKAGRIEKEKITDELLKAAEKLLQ